MTGPQATTRLAQSDGEDTAGATCEPAPAVSSPSTPRPGRDTTPPPDPGRAAVPGADLDIWQWYGQACVECGRKFDRSESGERAGLVGDNQHAVYRCSNGCPTSVASPRSTEATP
jgi:hypothetical protein